MKLKKKIAIITGATSGIGVAAAKLFAAEGAEIVAVGRNSERGEAVTAQIRSAGGKAVFVQADVSKSQDVKELVQNTIDAFGRIDILYNNAGIEFVGTITNTTEEQWDRVINTNLKSVFLMCKYVIPHMAKQGSGVIVNTASELGLVAAREFAAYCASKGGIVNLTRAIAVDCATFNIRVNCLCPGPVTTPMLDRALNATSDPAKSREAQIVGVPLRRMGTPEEIARAALFLASDDSSYCLGSVVVVDGGATSWYGL